MFRVIIDGIPMLFSLDGSTHIPAQEATFETHEAAQAAMARYKSFPGNENKIVHVALFEV